MKRCKLCRAQLNDNNIIANYRKMPNKAQFFPMKEKIESDVTVDLVVFQCPYCGLVQILDEPVVYYKQVIRAIGVSDEMKKFRTQYFSEFINKYSLHKKNIIEIGAGCGEYMELMSLSDVNVYGLEDKIESVSIARGRNLQMFEGFVDNENTKIPNAPYDAFYIMNFLEHIPNLNSFLKGIYNNICDNGVGLVEVPNADFILSNNLFTEFMLDHLSYFTRETLIKTLELNGFIVDKCEVIWDQYILAATVHKRPKGLYCGLKTEQEQLIKNVRKFIINMHDEGRKVAIWGAGHQALAVLAITEIQNEIECVIDSAEFKQNRYTPATHVLVCSPAEINKRGITAILVIAGAYSNEVIKLIEKKYSIVKRCAVLNQSNVKIQEI